MKLHLTSLAIAAACMTAVQPAALAQEHIPGKVDIAFNRYYSYDQLVDHMHAIAAAYPEIVRKLRP